jgi:hypothetical protein
MGYMTLLFIPTLALLSRFTGTIMQRITLLLMRVNGDCSRLRGRAGAAARGAGNP